MNKDKAVEALTRRVAALEAMLRNSETYLLDDLFESMFEGVQVIDFDLRYVYLNRTAAEHGRRPREELIGQRITDMYPGIDQTEVFGLMRLCMEERSHQQMENRFTYPDGSDAWFDLRINPVAQGIMVLSIDVTQQKETEHQLHQSQKMEAVGSLAGGIAHDFNNLVTVIAGYADLLARHIGGDPTARNAVGHIQQSTENAAALSRQLLAFSRRQVLVPKVVDVNRVVERAGAMLSRLMGENIELLVRPRAGLDKVVCDPGQIEQVFMNLALNARDAMPDGGKLIVETSNVVLDEAYCRMHPGARPGSYIVLAVTDTGVGMDPKVRARIFEPFFTTKQPGKGTGLGLSTVYGIVKQSGGSVWVYSESGRGTTFKVYLPSVGDVPADDDAPARATIGGTETILLVEDEEGVRALFETVLAEAGYTVLSAPDGAAAMRVCSSHQGAIHAVLTDLVLPDTGGKALAAKLQGLCPDVKVIFTSGYTPATIAEEGDLEPGSPFIEKPVRPSALLEQLRRFLER